MERTGDVRHIQGGGDGEGFKVPREVLRQESVRFQVISRQAIEFSNLESTINDDEGKTCPVETAWKRELCERLFVLKQRRSEQHADRPFRDAAISLNRHLHSSSNRNNDRYPSRVQGSEAQDDTDLNTQMQTINSNGNRSRSIRARGPLPSGIPPRVPQFHNSSYVRVVPSLPSSIEEVVLLWRFGSPETMNEPLYRFSSALIRKQIIPRYSNRMWQDSAQKYSFMRIKKLVAIVAALTDDLDIATEGNEESWSAAIDRYHRNFDVDGKPVALSNVLRITKEW